MEVASSILFTQQDCLIYSLMRTLLFSMNVLSTYYFPLARDGCYFFYMTDASYVLVFLNNCVLNVDNTFI